MFVILFHVRDITADGFADTQLEPLDQRMARAEQLVGRLGAVAQGLIEIFPGRGMYPVEIGIEFRIEDFHIGKAFRRLEIVNPDQRVIAVQRLIALVTQHAPGCSQYCQRHLVVRRQRHASFAKGRRLFGIAGLDRHFRHTGQQVGIVAVLGQQSLKDLLCLPMPLHQIQRVAHACGGLQIVGIHAGCLAIDRMRFLGAFLVGEEKGLRKQQLHRLGGAVVGFEIILVTQAVHQVVVEFVPFWIAGIAGDQARAQGYRFVIALESLQHIDTEGVDGKIRVEGRGFFEILQRFLVSVLAMERLAEGLMYGGAHLLRHRLRQGGTQKAFGFLRVLDRKQQAPKRQFGSGMAGQGGKPLPEYRFGVRHFAQLLQGGSGFVISLAIIGLQGKGGLEGVDRLLVALQPTQRGAVTESQDRLTGIGGAGSFKQIGRIRVALLVHPHQPGHVQQPGIAGEALKQGGQSPVGGVGVPGLEGLICPRERLRDGRIGCSGDHDATL